MNIKIYNNDCLDFMKSIKDKSIDLIIADPPYDLHIGIDGGSCAVNCGRSKSFKNENLKGIKDFGSGYDIKSFGNEFVRIMKNINIYFWCNKAQIPEYFNFYVNELGCKFEILCWHKINTMPTYNNKYLTDTEYCLYFRNGVGQLHPSKYEEAKTYWIEPVNQIDKRKYNHPTIKPLYIIENLIKNSSNEGDLVFDPFLGSGTTAIACKKLNRNFIGTEINEDYYKMSLERINDNDPSQISEFFE